jgi:hypothetical protein
VLDLAGHIDAVQQHVGGAQQVRQLLFSMPRISVSMAALSAALDLVETWLRKWSMARSKPPVPQAGSITVSPELGFTVGHELGDGARGVELARVAGAAQVVEQLFVQSPRLARVLKSWKLMASSSFSITASSWVPDFM